MCGTRWKGASCRLFEAGDKRYSCVLDGLLLLIHLLQISGQIKVSSILPFVWHLPLFELGLKK